MSFGPGSEGFGPHGSGPESFGGFGTGDTGPDMGGGGGFGGISLGNNYGYGPGDNPGRTHLGANVGWSPSFFGLGRRTVEPGYHINSLQAFQNRSPTAYALSRVMAGLMPFGNLAWNAFMEPNRNAPMAPPTPININSETAEGKLPWWLRQKLGAVQ